VPAGSEAERARLLLEVGELAAGHLVEIDLGRAGAEIDSNATYCRTAQ
jgi:hypothetical protein